MIGGVLLGAGGASRFGSPKQLAPLDGRPLIEHALDAMLSVPAIGQVVVVLGAEAARIEGQADLDGAEVVIASDWREGAAASLRAGVAHHAAAGAEAAVITLADQPLITAQVIAAVLDMGLEARAPATRATYAGAPGHPVLIKSSLFAAVAELEGDIGARSLLASNGAATIECGHLCSPADVDEPEELEAIRSLVTPAAGEEEKR